MDDDIQDNSIAELLKRQQELKRKLVQAHRAGMSQGVINQIQFLIAEVEFTLTDKMAMDQNRQSDKGNDFDDLIIG